MTKDIVAYARNQQHFMRKISAAAHNYFHITESRLTMVKSNGTMKILGTDADKIADYFQQQYYKNDPHLVKPQNIDSGIVSWLDNPALFSCKMSYGFSVVLKVKKTCYYSLSCATTAENATIYNNLLNDQLFIKLFINHLINKTQAVLALAPELDLVQYKGKQFSKQAGITVGNSIEISDSIKQYFPELEY